MDPDVAMAIGLLLAIVSFPSLIHNVLHDGAPSKVVGFMCLTSVTIMAIAALNKPGGYEVMDLPRVLMDVLGRFV